MSIASLTDHTTTTKQQQQHHHHHHQQQQPPPTTKATTTTNLILQGANMAHERVDLVLVLFHLPVNGVFLVSGQLLPRRRHLKSVGGALVGVEMLG